MKAMILAAGLGTRMQALTKEIPKPLLKVGKLSLIELSINNLINSGVKEFVINISYLGEQIKATLEPLNKTTKITFIEEPFPYGTGGALINAREHLGKEPFILSNADIFFKPDLTKLPGYTGAIHLIATKNPDHNQSGDFSLDGRAIFISASTNDYTYSGVALINPKILDEHLSSKYPYDIWNTLFKPIILRSQATAHFDNSLWIDVGTPERLKLAREVVKDENH
jgi:MurNAc alpha-1-phosphate uridylyltransferase